MGIINMELVKELFLAKKIEKRLGSRINQLDSYITRPEAEPLIGHISDLFKVAEEYNDAGFEPKIELEGYRVSFIAYKARLDMFPQGL